MLVEHVVALARSLFDVQAVLECLARGCRRHADLACGHLLALLLDRLNDVLGHQPTHLQLVRIEPNPHRILTGAKNRHVAHPGQPRQFIAYANRRVIAEKKTVVGCVRGSQRHEQQDRRGPLLHGDSLGLHRLRQRRQRTRHPVLHQHLREVEIGTNLERHRERVGAVGATVGLHVEHALDAVHLLLDRQRYGIHDGLGAGAGIACRDLHRWRHYIRILRDRQAE